MPNPHCRGLGLGLTVDIFTSHVLCQIVSLKIHGCTSTCLTTVLVQVDLFWWCTGMKFKFSVKI